MNTKVLGISYVFPRIKRPSYGTFAYSLFKEISKQGAEVSVIAPYPISRKLYEIIDKTGKKKNIKIDEKFFKTVLRPSTFSVSTRLLPIRCIKKHNFKSFINSVRRVSKRIKTPDWIIAYFFDAGCAALEAFRGEIPVFVEIGESDFYVYKEVMTYREIKDYLNKFSGIIAVSKNNKNIIENYLYDKEKIILLENGVDIETFRPINKEEARKVLGFPQNIIIIGFVGAFIERKGPLRVLEAINKLNNIYGVFIGRGNQIPRGEKVLFCGEVPNEILPFYLSSFDSFCLPSLQEGLSVAIVEAAACGLPLIVSDRPFNRSFLSEENAIFIDPESPDDIAHAIDFLMRNKDLINKIRLNNLGLAKKHSLSIRVQKLFDFVNRRMQYEN